MNIFVFLFSLLNKLKYSSDRIEEADIDVQTDAFLDRPPSPLFIPQSTGKDIATQIEAGDVKLLSSNFFEFKS